MFTLSTNFPIIAITLSNNLKAVFLTEGRRYGYWTRTALFPLLALLPPTAIAMATHSLELLVSIYTTVGSSCTCSKINFVIINVDTVGWDLKSNFFANLHPPFHLRTSCM